MMLTCLGFALMIGAQAPQPATQGAPPPATAVIRGRVVGADTGQPLRRARVQLMQIDAPTGAAPTRENRTITTDADGKYEFKDLPSGRYNINASKGAYVGVTWGQQPPPAVNSAKPIDLHAGDIVEHVDFTLARGGVITGRVLDEFGEPLTGIQISVMRAQMVGGARRLMQSDGATSTNDAGEFRIFGIAPGQYYLQAAWLRVGPGDPTSPDHTGYPTTFFPGTTNEAEAQRVTVAAGQTISDLVMALSPIKTARVEGIVVDADGRPMGGVVVTMMQTIGNMNSMSGSSVRADGTFVYASLPPGDYVFRTEPTPTRPNTALMKITIGSEDITDLRLVAMPPATISGRIVIDPAMSFPTTAFSVMANPDNQMMPGGMQPARVDDDLSFSLTALPGRNRINLLNLPPGWGMRSARLNGVDVIDDGFEVKPGEKLIGLDVELTTRIPTVSGLVTNSRGEAVKDYTVLIFATDSKRWKSAGRYLRTARPDQDGRFKISGMAPADYYVIAIDKLEPGQFSDPDFLERVRSKATTITVGDGDTKTIDLKITIS